MLPLVVHQNFSVSGRHFPPCQRLTIITILGILGTRGSRSSEAFRASWIPPLTGFFRNISVGIWRDMGDMGDTMRYDEISARF